MKHIRWIGALAGVVAASQTGDANADTTQDPLVARAAALTMIGSGAEKNLGRPTADDPVDPNSNRRAGPGFEQATMTHITGADGAHYLVVLVMESVYIDNIGPYQVSCNSFKLNDTSAPTPVVMRKLMTHNKGDRPANHPMAVRTVMPSGQELIFWSYGSQMGENRTKTYASVTNEKCEQLLPDQMISSALDAGNNDRGAPDVAYHGIADGAAVLSFAYFSNGNDKDTYFGSLKLADNNGLLSLTPVYESMKILGPTNIGRPALVADGPDRAILCTAVDGNRPAHNVSCARLKVSTGEVLFKNYIAMGNMDADPYKRSYMGQPTITKMSDGVFALQILESNGSSKNGGAARNLKGSNFAHLYHLEVNQGTEALVTRAVIDGAAPYHQTHAQICSGAFGTDGKRVVAVVGAPPTGIGRAAMLTVHFDPTQAAPFTYDKILDTWPVNWYGDSGHLANLYGENPGRQGRDFMRCIGDVPNPGYHVKGGFMPDVKSFFAAAIPGRQPGDPKNSLWVSLLPAETDTKGTPQNPVDARDVPTAPPTTPTAEAPKDSSGCACVSGGQPVTPGEGLGSLALFGLVALGVRSRRRA